MIFGHASSLKVIILRIYGIELSRADVQECDFSVDGWAYCPRELWVMSLMLVAGMQKGTWYDVSDAWQFLSIQNHCTFGPDSHTQTAFPLIWEDFFPKSKFRN